MPGFTLIETIIYTGLFALLLSTAITGTESISESIGRSQTHALLETEGHFLLAKIAYDPSHINQSGSFLIDTKTTPGTVLSSPEVVVSNFSHDSLVYSFTLSAKTSTGQTESETFLISPNTTL